MHLALFCRFIRGGNSWRVNNDCVIFLRWLVAIFCIVLYTGFRTKKSSVILLLIFSDITRNDFLIRYFFFGIFHPILLQKTFLEDIPMLCDTLSFKIILVWLSYYRLLASYPNIGSYFWRLTMMEFFILFCSSSRISKI